MKTRMLKTGDTIVSLFDSVKCGEKIKVPLDQVKETSVRQEAVRRNAIARRLGETKQRQVLYSVSIREADGYVTISRNQ